MVKRKQGMNKRMLLLAGLVLVLGIAVYFNWHLSQNENSQSATDTMTGSTMGQAVYVNADASSQTDPDDYFVQTRQQREESRKKATDALEEIINHAKSDSSAIADATAKATAIAKGIETESNMEALIRAKGFQECLVIMGEQSVTVVVKTEGLLASDMAQIQEIAEQNSGFSLENIKIIEVK